MQYALSSQFYLVLSKISMNVALELIKDIYLIILIKKKKIYTYCHHKVCVSVADPES